MGAPRITLAIPTCNRARFLARAIRSILEQRPDGVEIVVSDNASTDDTADVVRALQAEHAGIEYVRLPKNDGFDPNFRSAIEASHGDWVWTLGDDDWIEPGAIARVLEALEAHPDVPGLTVQCNGYTVDEALAVPAACTGEATLLRGAPTIMAHRNMGYLFGNMSIHVFRRDKALAHVQSGRLFQNGCSGHHLMCLLVERHQTWVYLDVAAVAWRYGNDSAMANGLLRRATLALRAYPEIVADVFGAGSPVHRQFMNEQETLVGKQFVIRAKNNAHFNQFLRPYDCGWAERWRINEQALRALYPYPRFWTQVAPLFFLPGAVLPLASRLKSVARRVTGTSAT